MASLNNLYKIDAGVFGAWMQVLVEVSLWRMDASVSLWAWMQVLVQVTRYPVTLNPKP